MGRVSAFDYGQDHKFELDKEQYIQYKKMTEGQRRRFQSALSSRPFVVNQATGEMSVTVDIAEQRYLLLKYSISGWNVFDGDKSVEFNDVELENFLENGNTDILDELENEIRKVNTWLLEQTTTLTEKQEEVLKKEKSKKVS